MEHPTEEALRRLLLGMTSRQENRQIVRHLLSRCPACAAAVMKIRKGPPVEPGAYDEALNRFIARLSQLDGAGEAGPRGGSPTSGGSTPRRASG